MASVSSTASVSPYSLQQFMLQQANQTADQAEQNAQSLKAQASEAQRAADRAQANARALAVQADQAEAQAVGARDGLAALTSAGQTLAQQSQGATKLLANEQTVTSTTSGTGNSPVVNSQGQVTGTIINTTA